MIALAFVMRTLLGIMFFGAGVYHFVNPMMYVRMMPDYLPLHLELVYLSGAIEIALAILFFIPRFHRLAAWGMIGLMVAVFPAHIHMYMHPDRYPEIPHIALMLRIPMQGVLIWWAWLYTRSPETSEISHSRSTIQ